MADKNIFNGSIYRNKSKILPCVISKLCHHWRSNVLKIQNIKFPLGIFPSSFSEEKKSNRWISISATKIVGRGVRRSEPMALTVSSHYRHSTHPCKPFFHRDLPSCSFSPATIFLLSRQRPSEKAVTSSKTSCSSHDVSWLRQSSSNLPFEVWSRQWSVLVVFYPCVLLLW